MQLTSLSLQYYRNYHQRSFSFFHETTMIVGGNGVGKTNILEASYLLATGKSFRAHRIEEMIMFEKELGRVKGVIVSDVPKRFESTQETSSARDDIVDLKRVSTASKAGEKELEVMLTRGEIQGKRVAKRRFQVDGVFKRSTDFVGNLVVVLFRPEDLQLILGSPQLRRGFVDDVLSQVDREYRRSLISYEKALYRRNRLLDSIRDQGASRTQLTFWDQLLIKHGQVLTEKRADFLSFVDAYEAEIDSFQLVYLSSPITQSRLQQYAEKELAAGYTLIGPHKDDFVLSFETGKALAEFGSRGEQRLAVLWMKLAELSFVSKQISEKPLLLLDDIFSELDQEHREMVLRVIPHQQTLISTTDPDFVKNGKGIDILSLEK